MSNAMLDARDAVSSEPRENAMLGRIGTKRCPPTNAMAQHRDASRTSRPTNAMYEYSRAADTEVRNAMATRWDRNG